MKKDHILILLSLLILTPGCLKKKVTALKNKVSTAFYGKNKHTFSTEELDEFILEIENDNDMFNPTNASPEDKNFSWRELEPDQEYNKIQFEFDSSEIKPSEAAKIRTNAKQIKKELKGRTKTKVSVRGHSCKIAKNQDWNYVLSQERAQKVADLYVENGIPTDKIKAVGYGSSLLLTDLNGIEAQSPNRRVETVLVVEE